jgi:hypothetical protein
MNLAFMNSSSDKPVFIFIGIALLVIAILIGVGVWALRPGEDDYEPASVESDEYEDDYAETYPEDVEHATEVLDVTNPGHRYEDLVTVCGDVDCAWYGQDHYGGCQKVVHVVTDAGDYVAPVYPEPDDLLRDAMEAVRVQPIMDDLPEPGEWFWHSGTWHAPLSEVTTIMDEHGTADWLHQLLVTPASLIKNIDFEAPVVQFRELETV